MTNLEKQWYSTDLVKDVITPNLVSWRSRYDLKEQLLLNNNNLVIRNLRASDMVPIRSSSDTPHIVAAGEAYRPDVIANLAYGDPRLAWVILAANNLSDIFSLTSGLEIIIPSVSSLYQTGGILSR